MRPGTHTAAPCPGRRRSEFHVTQGSVPPRAGRLPADHRYASGNRKTPGRRPECQDAGPAVVLFAIISSRRDGRPADPLHASRRRQEKRRVRWRGLHEAKKGPRLCAIVPDGGMKASQGNRPPRAAFTHPAGVAMRRKRERPSGRPCPGGRSTAAGEKGENPPHRPPGNGWGETGGHGHAMQKNRAPPMAGRRPCAGGSQRKKGLKPARRHRSGTGEPGRWRSRIRLYASRQESPSGPRWPGR